MKEFIRKSLVSLKRSPQNIALVGLVFSFVYYSFNLRKISDTTAKIQGSNMGLCGFITMLLSILVFVVFLNSFPKRQKPNFAMIALMYVMFVIMIVSDFIYRNGIALAKARPDFANTFEQNDYIMKAYSVVGVHALLVIIVAVLIALLPVYSKLLKKINTSIDVEGNANMSTVEISEE